MSNISISASLQPDRGVDLYIDVMDANRDDDSMVLLWMRKENKQVWYFEEGKSHLCTRFGCNQIYEVSSNIRIVYR